jgi:hypothetical protein
MVAARERREQTIRVFVLQIALDALGAELAAVEREVLPRFEADDALVLDLELDAALLSAEAAVRRHHAIRLAPSLPAAGGHVARMGAEVPDEFRNRRG